MERIRMMQALVAALLPASLRAWLYAVAVAAGPVLVYYGLVSAEAWPLWLALVLALLMTTDQEVPTPAGARRALPDKLQGPSE